MGSRAIQHMYWLDMRVIETAATGSGLAVPGSHKYQRHLMLPNDGVPLKKRRI